jgi:Na+-transporting NADH:ubiquinone oxidoreductase subunit NqrA
MVIVTAEGARQELLSENKQSGKNRMLSGNKLSSRCWALDNSKYQGLIVICSIL